MVERFKESAHQFVPLLLQGRTEQEVPEGVEAAPLRTVLQIFQSIEREPQNIAFGIPPFGMLLIDALGDILEVLLHLLEVGKQVFGRLGDLPEARTNLIFLKHPGISSGSDGLYLVFYLLLSGFENTDTLILVFIGKLHQLFHLGEKIHELGLGAHKILLLQTQKPVERLAGIRRKFVKHLARFFLIVPQKSLIGPAHDILARLLIVGVEHRNATLLILVQMLRTQVIGQLHAKVLIGHRIGLMIECAIQKQQHQLPVAQTQQFHTGRRGDDFRQNTVVQCHDLLFLFLIIYGKRGLPLEQTSFYSFSLRQQTAPADHCG